MDDKIIAAIIAAITSIITLLISNFFKPKTEKKIQVQKIEIENTYEQIREIKKTLSQYKVHIVNSAVSLRGRLSNLSKNHEKEWHNVNGDYLNINNYYFQSTIYRILRLYAWISILEKNLIFLDTTIASSEDLYFIKYLKAIRRTLQRSDLVKGLEDGHLGLEADLIFRDTLDEMSLWMINDNQVMSFTEFKLNLSNNIKNYNRLCEFVDGISSKENRLRWDRLYCLGLLLLAFINSYGYDFQFKDKNKIKRFIKQIGKNTMLANFVLYLEKYKLSNEKNIKLLLESLSELGIV